MPKVSVYLPQELYDRAKENELPISTLAQEAIEAALSRRSNDAWIERMRSRPPWTGAEIDTAAVMDEVRGEWGT